MNLSNHNSSLHSGYLFLICDMLPILIGNRIKPLKYFLMIQSIIYDIYINIENILQLITF